MNGYGWQRGMEDKRSGNKQSGHVEKNREREDKYDTNYLDLCMNEMEYKFKQKHRPTMKI